MQKSILVANSPITNSESELLLKAIQACSNDALIVGCDGGAVHLCELNLIPNIVVGDFDSINKEIRVKLENNGSTKIYQYPSDKDASDLELALDLILSTYQVSSIILFGCTGGRTDFSSTNLNLIAKFAAKHPLVSFELICADGKFLFPSPNKLHVINITPNNRFSLIPLSDEVNGIILDNAKWPLNNETLFFGSSRGLSNIALSGSITLSFNSGRLAVLLFKQD